MTLLPITGTIYTFEGMSRKLESFSQGLHIPQGGITFYKKNQHSNSRIHIPNIRFMPKSTFTMNQEDGKFVAERKTDYGLLVRSLLEAKYPNSAMGSRNEVTCQIENSQTADNLQSNCRQTVSKPQPNCNQNAARMQSNCSQTADKL